MFDIIVSAEPGSREPQLYDVRRVRFDRHRQSAEFVEWIDGPMPLDVATTVASGMAGS